MECLIRTLMAKSSLFRIGLLGIYIALLLDANTSLAEWQTPSMAQYAAVPPFTTNTVPPLVMLVMGRDHKLYYEAYNDASDLNDDGVLDTTYKPDEIDYYGYFDSYKYYTYSSGVFVPAGITEDKKAPSGNNWSGDFLNYLTMSRMDALRKVLYGGYRYTDTATETVLERAYIPQDAHSWGKEYESIARDGYDIREYTPLDLPKATPCPNRHLFSSTSLYLPTNASYRPLLRVLNDSTYRIWEWVSIETPVAGSRCEDGGSGPYCATSGGSYWEIVPSSTTYGISQITTKSYDLPTTFTHPADENEYDAFVANIQNSIAPAQGSATTINSNSATRNILSVFDGTLIVPCDGDYTFNVNGSDAVDFRIDLNGDGDFDDSGEWIAGYYGAHLADATTVYDHQGTVALEGDRGYAFQYRHEVGNRTSPRGAYYLQWYREKPASSITDYVVRVKVADPDMPESNCKQYPNGNYKPIGILQRHGESDSMYFGLITGSYTKNMSGGVLRKNIGSIIDEVNADTGEFQYLDNSSISGIIKTIDSLRILEFNSNRQYDGGWVTTRTMNQGEFPDWGNPIGEMMYEALRYLSGAKTPSAAFWSTSMADDNTLGLPNASWNDPYAVYPFCSRPFILTISDIYPSYDSDQLPGAASAFGSVGPAAIGNASSSLDVEEIADLIYAQESSTGKCFIGQQGATYDGACTAKTVDGFGDIRGLCPEEPTKQGSYYSAAVAYYGRTEDMSAIESVQQVRTYAVALASPLPQIEVRLQGKTVRLVPFAKSVGGYSINAASGSFQPTNTIVDFYVEEIGAHYGRFRINFEDVEQGADHDMDAIVLYEYRLLDSSGTAVTESNIDTAVSLEVTLISEYAGGSIIQHCGYILSGTTADGTYLEVRDADTAAGSDVNYFLDTPNDSNALPLTNTRIFTVDASAGASSATLLTNPLWYAAKWGSFEDANDNGIPDQKSEWDADGDGTPDTYFYVANPTRLEEQLNKSFADILAKTSSGTAASVISNSRSGEGAIYQSIFYPSLTSGDRTVGWVGQVHALLSDANGNMREDTNKNSKLDLLEDRIIAFDGATVCKYLDMDEDGILDESEEAAGTCGGGVQDISFLWTSSDWLNELTDSSTQRAYGAKDQKRYIFTFVDADGDMVADAGEQMAFAAPSAPTWAQLVDPAVLFAYLHTHTPFEPPVPLSDSDYQTIVAKEAQRVVDYIRGEDQVEVTVGEVILPAFRSRQIDYDDDNDVETWRLGDIVHSTPKLVGAPFESYDLIYKDAEYTEFYATYQNRRNMVYVGANDGMLHAFNGGFFDSDSNAFLKQPLNSSGNPDSSYSAHDLGAEIWAYIPFNLLPHLLWLTDTSYPHVYYCDLEPKAFEAKIFENDDNHPNGWGTVLVGGMRLGGGKIAADMDKQDGLVYNADKDKVMTSAYFILDITNPEKAPELLAEIAFPDLGYTTCYPAVVPLRDKDASTGELKANEWYIVFGSGPTGGDGPDTTALQTGTSLQQAVMYAIDLKKLAQDKELWTVTGNGVIKYGNGSGPFYLAQFSEKNSSVSEPIAVDYELDYMADVVYFGTSFGDHANGWGGKLRRIVLQNGHNDPLSPQTWATDSVLIDLSESALETMVANGQPIQAAATAGLDDNDQRWVYFGTGRYYASKDGENTDQQSFYGIKEPYTLSGGTKTFTWGSVGRNDLTDVTDVKVYRNGDYVETTIPGVSNFDTLVSAVDDSGGWVADLDWVPNKERNLGQAVLAGDILTFTTYVPSNDPCTIEGETALYALYYLTGTAYYQSVLGLDDGDSVDGNELVLKRLSLGSGLSLTPNIHVGSEQGTTAYIQSSTGAIITLEEENPGVVKSGKVLWKADDDNLCPAN